MLPIILKLGIDPPKELFFQLNLKNIENIQTTHSLMLSYNNLCFRKGDKENKNQYILFLTLLMLKFPEHTDFVMESGYTVNVLNNNVDIYSLLGYIHNGSFNYKTIPTSLYGLFGSNKFKIGINYIGIENNPYDVETYMKTLMYNIAVLLNKEKGIEANAEIKKDNDFLKAITFSF